MWGTAQWQPIGLLFVASLLALVSYLFTSVQMQSTVISATFQAIVLVAVFLGPVPAAALVIVNELLAWPKRRHSINAMLTNIAVIGWAAIVAGLVLGALITHPLSEVGPWTLVGSVFLIGSIVIAINGACMWGLWVLEDGKDWRDVLRNDYLRVLPSHVLTLGLTAVVAVLYAEIGLAAMTAFVSVMLMNQVLIQRLLAARDETKRLASLNTGILASLVRGLHLRDRDTARHSAAVARYAREMAQELGWSKERQELVHTAALLHDVGKFAFPDNILRGGLGLSNADWEQVRRHPDLGAELLRGVSGYGPIADIVAAHHERPDGQGYPQGLAGESIPEASRLIAVADAYDVITARGGYNKGRSSFDALRELRRCTGTQFDGQFVEALASTLAGKDLRFRHGDDADFDAEVDKGGEQLKIAVG